MSAPLHRSRRRLHPAAPRSTSALSFADLMVNLLTFFVLLFAWSKPADGARFSAGIGGFLHHLDSWGLPPSAEDELRREERIRELEGRFRLFAPRRIAPGDSPRQPLVGALPFAEGGLLPGIARFEAGSEELSGAAPLAELARALRDDPAWCVRLELVMPAAEEAEGAAAAERSRARLAAGRAHLSSLGFAPERIATARVAARSGSAEAQLDLRLLRRLPPR
ncbi:MAG: hypothetical protein IPN34_20605 [Planctomycetes bacterium]|nr:hypothetical protein [Planctomycetota bacterium]